jgi:hypothetical protein
MERAPEEHSHRLSPGTLVGQWCVEAWQGEGAYGAVYRALHVGQEHASPAALKLSLHAWDGRFGREAELLSRLSHPSIPRLLERGLLRHGSGAEYPYFVMEWVEGTPLYAWAQQHAASYQQLCQLLAQLAGALEALHAANAVHRDVKGDNVLVRHSDGRAVLIDFGACHFQGAPRLTWQSLPPFTLAYRSAQAALFYIRLARARDSYYEPTPADDLYALGVTAYRLVMGEYPPPMDVQQDEEGAWQVSSPDPRPLLENNPRVQPLLREWILRLLSDVPEARCTATQVAEALEVEAEGREAVLPPAAPAATEVLALKAPAPAGAGEREAELRPATPAEVLALEAPALVGPGEQPGSSKPVARVRRWNPWLALAAAGACAVLLWKVSASPPRAAASEAPDAGTAAVGDSSPTEPQASIHPPSKQEPIGQELPPKPRRGESLRQLQPDEKGRCPGRKHVVINGGCWVEQASMNVEECTESGYLLLKGKCYAHAIEPAQEPVPTSNPAKAR